MVLFSNYHLQKGNYESILYLLIIGKEWYGIDLYQTDNCGTFKYISNQFEILDPYKLHANYISHYSHCNLFRSDYYCLPNISGMTKKY